MPDTWTPAQIFGLVRQPQDNGLFKRLALPVADSQPRDCWALTRSGTDHSILTLVRPDGVALAVDFNAGKARHRTTESGKGAQALAKALGIRRYYREHADYPTLIDATGGLGQDAWALASLGCTLHVIESHPIVHALLADGLLRALQDENTCEIASRLSLIHGDAIDQLSTLSAGMDVHAIYLDPMYPARRKRASSKKGMQFLQTLVADEASEANPALLLAALQCPVSRVAVKRPRGAALLAGSELFAGQRTSVDTPNTRYDIYHVV